MPSVILAIFVLLASASAQTDSKKATPLTPAKADTWQKSKECAAQAEKLIKESDAKAVAMGAAPALDWRNHYSQKCNRCFFYASYMYKDEGAGKTVPRFMTQLTDAFERSVLANSAAGGPTNGFCNIDGNETDCDKALAFITEHMKN